ncbi:PD40 domain-containing protein [Parasphingorhabdus cellanae]|uniref:PD40 domain-containing protein n=1 Tax=Parasphingorhabdus cellanae TaxID=2806553 RepID=A0ABX7T088_9SPHN|nr:PD40 domain-containing protein [Parasphingorhabdus cellanae]
MHGSRSPDGSSLAIYSDRGTRSMIWVPDQKFCRGQLNICVESLL